MYVMNHPISRVIAHLISRAIDYLTPRVCILLNNRAKMSQVASYVFMFLNFWVHKLGELKTIMEIGMVKVS